MNPLVSVIVPVYGVEQFVEQCARSLFNQSLAEVEFIYVDDASPDKSIEKVKKVLKEFPNRETQVRIIHHDVNRGLPAARNSGLSIATGEYIFHCDSDDYVEPQMLERLYRKAKEQDADIVWCDWFLTFEKSERYMKQPIYDMPLDAVKAMLGGGMKFNVWNKLVKRNLYVERGISFPDGYGMGEDMTMIMLFAMARKIAYMPEAFYHYVKTNINAFSQTYSERHLKELRYNVRRVEMFVTEQFGQDIDEYVAYMKLEAKFPFLLSNDTSRLRLWSKWYSEANPYIMSNKNVSLRNRCLQWCALKNQMLLLRLYSFVFNQIIYGFLYK